VHHPTDGAAPLVHLPEVKVESGEEHETPLWHGRSKLFRFDKTDNQWKERGTGIAKLLQHNETKKIRFLMRREGTLKLCSNHLVMPEMDLKPAMGCDRAWVWHTGCDFSEEEDKEEIFAIRFPNSEQAREFREKFEEAKVQMKHLVGSK